jgi:hypothetical protein
MLFLADEKPSAARQNLVGKKDGKGRAGSSFSRDQKLGRGRLSHATNDSSFFTDEANQVCDTCGFRCPATTGSWLPGS